MPPTIVAKTAAVGTDAAASGATIQPAGVARSKFVPPVAGIDGNWECFQCMSINFASREHCHRCNGARPPQEQIKRRAEQIKAERAVQVAANADRGATILAMLPDTGERYLSTYLFEEVPEGSDDEWLASLETA